MQESKRRFSKDRALVATQLKSSGLLDMADAVASLRATRESRGLTLAQVSAASGITIAALSRLESGLNENPTLRTLQRVAAALGLKFAARLVPV